MSWRSIVSEKFGKRDSDAKRENENPTSHPVDRVVPSDRRQEIVAALKAHLETVHRSHRDAGDIADFDPNLDLLEAGYLDSLTASEFLLLAEKQYSMPLPDWIISGSGNSLASLAAYIEAELARDGS